jgi:ribonuclease R
VTRASRSRHGDVDIPGRDQILEHLRERGTPMRADDLAAALGVHGAAERDAFAGRLAAMERDGQLMTNRKGELCVVAKLDLATGRVQGHPDGFGFLVPDAGGPDLFLSPKEMHKTLRRPRDSAPSASTAWPFEGTIATCWSANREIVGRLYGPRLVPVARTSASTRTFGAPDMRGSAKPGQVVVAGDQQPSAPRSCRSSAATPTRHGNQIALRKRPAARVLAAAKRQAAHLPAEVLPRTAGPVDVTNLPLVTIDGELRRISTCGVLRARRQRARLVSPSPTSATTSTTAMRSTAMRERGTSVYFPRRVICCPGFQRALFIEGGVDRLCMVCDIAIDSTEHQRIPFLPCGHAFARGSPTIRSGTAVAAGAGRAGDRRYSRIAESARPLQAVVRRARETRRHRFRDDRARTQIRYARQDRGDRAGRPQ